MKKTVLSFVLPALFASAAAFAHDRPQTAELLCRQLEPSRKAPAGLDYAVHVQPIAGTSDLVDVVVFNRPEGTGKYAFVSRTRARWVQEDVEVWLKGDRDRTLVKIYLDEMDQTTLYLRGAQVGMTCHYPGSEE